MSNRYVQCASKAGAIAANESGLLYINYGQDTPEWGHDERVTSKWIHAHYGAALWPPEDFAVLVDDEDG